MTSPKMNFEPPVIVGALCSKMSEVPEAAFRLFSKFKKRAALLPFQVETKYLKNTLACMQLMDIEGLWVFGKHRKSIARHLKHLDHSSKETGLVDVIVRKGKRFVGMDVGWFLSDMKIARGKKVGLFRQSAVELLTQRLV